MESNRHKRTRAGACATCRARKRRCVPADRGSTCQMCLLLSIPCSLNSGSRLRIQPPNGLVGSSQLTERSPSVDRSRELLYELVPLYFRFIHNIAHTMFHVPSFMRRLNEGKAFMVHIHAMCALAARYSNNRIFDGISPCLRGRIFASEAVRLCQQHIASPSLETVQGFILISYYFAGEGEVQAKHVYAGLARLHAEALPMSAIPNDSNVVYEEEYRRTWLSVHIANHWSASDMSMEPMGLGGDSRVPPAIDDVSFHMPCPELVGEGPSMSSTPRRDMWAQMAKTLDIFTEINKLLRQLSRGLISFDDYCVNASFLENRLDQWAGNLPLDLGYNLTNIMLFVDQQLGRTFLSMHIGYYHFQQMLLFPFLDARAAQNTAESTVRHGAAKCKSSANLVAEILQYSTKIKNCELEYFIYGHIAVVSSCVHLHTLLFSDVSLELDMARQQLVSNFQYLMSLKSYWPVVQYSITRLQTFQNSCRDSASDPFAMDNWMARFLTEHSSVLSERQLIVSSNGHVPDNEAFIPTAIPS
ncbi:hypothetical protein P170DRAFT_381458 [Aspergillus steynii IBT 23096]|uniref:Zn(2)-C6 fungal-type domain-containing protein n=1 Tax=Aspergillus steynii IBT 23096 TaxID=1392250 RepID=A0A2I2GCH7_9EURO|nr:uncharacterized protein P170DRAFT_381458 [Aspergillus steynii IBT 23096]PLB50586.1 hypothetical protein P170DRAFT_381458 [Aspergillus steynii IBT 23096]